MFREVKSNERITDKTVNIAFDPDKRIERVKTETREIRIFDPDVRGCYRTVMVPVASGTTED